MPIDEKTAFDIVNSLPRAVLLLENRKIIFVNSAVEAIFGWTPAELLGQSIRVLYRNEEEYERIGERVYSRLETEKTYSEMYPCRHKDGHDVVCNVDVARRGERLENRGVVVMYEDITEKIEAEKELQESEEQYRNFVENTHEIVQSMALDGRFLSVNNSWQETFGYTREEMDDLNLFDIVKADFKQHLENIFKEVLAGKPIINEEIHFIAKAGHEIILEGNFIPRTFYGKVINIRCFFRDMTDNRRVQREINEKIDELERFNKVVVDREFKMIELKEKINELENQLNRNKVKTPVLTRESIG